MLISVGRVPQNGYSAKKTEKMELVEWKWKAGGYWRCWEGVGHKGIDGPDKHEIENIQVFMIGSRHKKSTMNCPLTPLGKCGLIAMLNRET